MTNRELLEAAAKAEGRDLSHEAGYWAVSGFVYWPADIDPEQRIPGERWPTWNPLTDDGDALRLAVKLGLGDPITISIGSKAAVVEFDNCAAHSIAPRKENEADPYASTRRAIVTAAAATAAEPQMDAQARADWIAR